MSEKTPPFEKNTILRLPVYFNTVNFTAFVSSIFFLLLVIFFPKHTTFIKERNLFIQLMSFLVLADAVFLYFTPILTRTKILLAAYLKSILWITALTGILYALGGIKNYFGLVLVFPILAATFDLDKRATLYFGGLSELSLISIALLDQRAAPTPEYYIIALSQIIFIGIFTFYLYSVINEGVRNRFEKEEARRKYYDLAEVDRAKTEFITIASHRLLKPLSELRLNFEKIFQTKSPNEELTSLLNQSEQRTETLIEIVRELIRASDQEKITYQKIRLDLNELIEKALAELNTQIARNEIKIEFIPEKEKFWTLGDSNRLSSVILDILDNAIKYSPRGSIKINLFKQDNRVQIKIEDTGIGIPLESQARLFTKFFRAPNALKLIPDSTGIGLYIAKSVIEHHGGKITFTSEPNKGTVFQINLPADN